MMTDFIGTVLVSNQRSSRLSESPHAVCQGRKLLGNGNMPGPRRWIFQLLRDGNADRMQMNSHLESIVSSFEGRVRGV